MRPLDRTSVPVPSFFLSGEAEAHNAEIHSFLSNPDFSRPPMLELRTQHRLEIMGVLRNWTCNKCSYCETQTESLDLDFFRPVRGVDRGRGKVDRLHYCWLGTEWENYFLACPTCNSIKQNLFPIKGRSEKGASLEVLRRSERPALIDPGYDDLSQHLIISPAGQMFGRTVRGASTIDLLKLNRRNLLFARQDLINGLIVAWNDVVVGDAPVEILLDRLRPASPHSGALYLFICSLLGKTNQKYKGWISDPGRIQELVRLIGHIRAEGLHEQYARQAHPSDIAQGSLPHRYRSLPIRRLRITNFKGIHDADLSFPMPSEKGAQWCALVGPNGIGKTTLLQALVLGLAGPVEAGDVVQDAREVLSPGAERGEIVVDFWHEDERNVVKFDRNSKAFFGTYSVAPPIIGYGAYRILARSALRRKYRQRDVRVHTLFDEHAKINGPHGWFRNLRGQKLDDAADVIQHLMLAPGAEVGISNNNIILSINRKNQPLKALSSGLQNVFALATDILDVMYSLKDSVLAAQAVILIDELDAHLHPAWRLRIVERLRAAFPMAQFIYSTHDPLTLRGVRGADVLVLTEPESGVIRAMPPVPEIDSLFVDQLLTSDLFGLNTTLDEALDGKFVRYYELLAKTDNDLADGERVELSELSEDLKNDGLMGQSMRERIMYRIIDRQLATARTKPAFSEWSEETIDMIEEALRSNPDYVELSND